MLGEKCYARLEDIPEKIDIVDIFRRSEFVPEIVDAAIRIGARAIWMQEGVEDEPSAERARRAGLFVIMDNCIAKEIYKRQQVGQAFSLSALHLIGALDAESHDRLKPVLLGSWLFPLSLSAESLPCVASAALQIPDRSAGSKFSPPAIPAGKPCRPLYPPRSCAY